jgi:alpha-tubulin suppressor-like RCC1 family protein
VPLLIGSGYAQVKSGAGAYFTIASKTDGSLVSWGNNERGQLGNGTINSRNTPGVVHNLCAENI